MRAGAAPLVFAACVLAAGCSDDAITALDLGVGPSDQLTLRVGGARRPMAAWFSFYVQPLTTDESQPPAVYLVVTAIDPAFDCAHPATGLDAISFLFRDRGAGAASTTVLSRRGPTLGSSVGGDASATLDSVDDRLSGYDLDAGTVASGAGRVTGRAHWVDGALGLDGHFAASHCAALDFIVPG